MGLLLESLRKSFHTFGDFGVGGDQLGHCDGLTTVQCGINRAVVR